MAAHPQPQGTPTPKGHGDNPKSKRHTPGPQGAGVNPIPPRKARTGDKP